jgi:hypothetical protein
MMCRWAAVVLVVMNVAAYALFLFAIPPRPSADDRFDGNYPGGRFDNVLGQSGFWQPLYGVALVVTLYAARTAIVYRCPEVRVAVVLYGAVALLGIPMMWVLVSTDWNNEHAELAYWFTLPVGILALPTVGFLGDLALRPYRQAWAYWLKTAVELLMIPAWLAVWIVFEFLAGFYWI